MLSAVGSFWRHRALSASLGGYTAVQNIKMRLVLKRLAWVAFGLVALVVVAFLGAQVYVGTDDFKARAELEASDALGVAVKLGRISVDLWPAPGLAVADIQVLTQPALTLAQLEVRPDVRGLLQGRLDLSTVRLSRAALAQPGLDALLDTPQKKKQTNEKGRGLEAENTSKIQWSVRQVLLDAITWVGARGDTVTLDADIKLDEQTQPEVARLTVKQGKFAGVAGLDGTRVTLNRQGTVWAVAVALGAEKGAGGGTIQGEVEVHSVTKKPTKAVMKGEAQAEGFTLKGQLETRDLDVSRFGGSGPQGAGSFTGPLSGRLEASTTLTARAAGLGSLAEALQTQSKFTVKNAVVHGIDLAQAVKTVGMSRGGETRLDVLSGQVQSKGRAVQLSNLVATSGVLSATGQVAISPAKQLSGRVTVALGSGLVGTATGVPLAVSGTLDAPEVTLNRSALIGAAIGTVLMPGVGTGAGASVGGRVGDALNKVFGR
jgi:hypothetical protein